MVQINWTYQSKIDLEDIFEYISRDSKKYAQIQTLRILKRTQILKKLPYSGKVIVEIHREDLRELVVKLGEIDMDEVRAQIEVEDNAAQSVGLSE